MAVKLNESAINHANRLIEDRRVVLDQRDDWSWQPAICTDCWTH